MKLYNSLSHRKEEFVPNEPGKVKMYTCGPTVYHFAHIGNLRSYIMEDVLEKYLRYTGYDVTRDEHYRRGPPVQRRRHRRGQRCSKAPSGAQDGHGDRQVLYRRLLCRLRETEHQDPPDVVQPATGCIDDFIKVITKLLDTGYAYIAAAMSTLIPQAWSVTMCSRISTRRIWP